MKRTMRVLSILVLVVTMTPSSRAHAQDASTGGVRPEARARDEAAVKDAIDGWWTKALENRDQRLAWFRDAKFGCFIHWGVYANPAGEYNGRKGGSNSEH